jgi:hypothetical protein
MELTCMRTWCNIIIIIIDGVMMMIYTRCDMEGRITTPPTMSSVLNCLRQCLFPRRHH